MKQLWYSMLMLGLAVTMCAGQMATTNSQSPATAGHKEGLFQVGLSKAIDAKKLKVGSEVEAEVLSSVNTGNMTIPRNAKVIGHVTQVETAGKGDSERTLSIVFDKINLGHGEEVPIHGTIQALAPNPNRDINTGGGVGYGGMNETMEKPPTPDMNSGPVPLLNQESTGVLGFKNLELGPDGALSSRKDIKLDSGTRMLLKVSF